LHANPQLHRYFTYLATEFPGIVALDDRQARYYANECQGKMLAKLILEYLPSEIENFNSLNLPIYLTSGNHHTLVFIDRIKRTVEYYDSLVSYGNHREIVNELRAIADALSEQEPDKPRYEVVSKIKKVLQRDGQNQCGVWTLYFLESRLRDPEFDFNELDINEAQGMIQKFRIKVMLKLIEMQHAFDSASAKCKADKIYEQSVGKMSHVDKWSHMLNSQALKPT
jgi:hypothetical protein